MTIDRKAFEGHTPGPWRVEKEGDHYIIRGEKQFPGESFGSPGTHIATLNIYAGMWRDRLEGPANAALIGAALDLLAELDRVTEQRDRLAEVVRSFLRAPSTGSDGPGSLTIVVQEFNLRDARAALATLDQED